MTSKKNDFISCWAHFSTIFAQISPKLALRPWPPKKENFLFWVPFL